MRQPTYYGMVLNIWKQFVEMLKDFMSMMITTLKKMWNNLHVKDYLEVLLSPPIL
jgi:hypothetical protein